MVGLLKWLMTFSCLSSLFNWVSKNLNIKFLITYSGRCICDQLCSKTKNNKLLQREWELLTKDLNNRLLFDKLFHRIVTKWVNIRVSSFVKAWIKIIRREREGKNQPGAQGEVSLRKSLDLKCFAKDVFFVFL